MAQNSDVLIAQLVGSLKPVKPMRFSHGMGYTLLAAAISTALVISVFGIRPDLQAGQFASMPMIATGLFLGLGIASGATVVVMSRPGVGISHSGWAWAAAMAALLPVAGLTAGISNGHSLLSQDSIAHGLDCFIIGTGSSVVVFATLVWWLRRGAPTAPDYAGLVAGIAAGSLGIFAFGLHCPENDIMHIGVWHSAVVLMLGALGRVIVPSLVRW
jgi:hypothetical protein